MHIDFGFMLSNSPGNIGFEGASSLPTLEEIKVIMEVLGAAAPFKLPMEYIEVLGGLEGEHFLESTLR